MHANLNLLNIVTRVQEMHSEFNSSNIRIKEKKNIAVTISLKLLIEIKNNQN